MSTKHPFEYQKPNLEQIHQIEMIRLACREVYDRLLKLPANRYRSLAITKLEEASMHANKGIVFGEDQ